MVSFNALKVELPERFSAVVLRAAADAARTELA